jgi:adenylate kinase family enzyme
MKRVIVIGSGGAGKSSFSRKLGEITGLPVTHLDQIYWRPNWQEPAKQEWAEIHGNATKADSWILDGNFGGTMEARLKACDTVIFLDLPRTVCLYRVLKRRLTHRGENRPDMAEGCNEKIDLEFLLWIWNYPKTSKLRRERLFEQYGEGKRIIRLTSQKDADNFLMSIRELQLES